MSVTLKQNLENLLTILPIDLFAEEEKELKQYLRKDNLDKEDTQKIIKIAKGAYPKLYAYYKIYNNCCRIKEEVGIHTFLEDEGIKARFDKYIKDDGDVEHIRQGKVEEIYLSESDIEAFKSAEREVHKKVHQEVQERINRADKKIFEDFIKDGEDNVRVFDEQIASLTQMAVENTNLDMDILNKIDELSARWVNFGNEPSKEDMAEVLEYYNSVEDII